ncbi:MAG: DUF6285 domain-containing protein [Rhodovibrionaceae bacterium]
MRDRPTSKELLDEAFRLLREELAPKLSGGERFKALMIANAVGMAARELEAGEAPLRRELVLLQTLLGAQEGDLVELNARLAAGLRDGAFAGDEQAYAALLEIAEAKVREVNPKALGQDRKRD